MTVHVPAWREIPARGAALFGAVAAGVYDDIDAAIAATRPSSSRTYTSDPAAKAVYDRVYAIYRTLYETLGRSDVTLLHGLKKIRTETAAG
jgi:L-ribulokinase